MRTKTQISILPFLLVLLAFLGGNVLLVLQYPLADPASHPVFRLHPLTYFLLILWVIQIAGNNTRHPIHNKSARLFGIIVFLVFVYSMTLGKSGGNFFILDTLLAPVLIVQLVQNESVEFKNKILYWVRFFFTLNCLLAIAERVMSTAVFPYKDPSTFASFRSSALTGHPLNGALITGFLTLFFVLIAKGTQRKFMYFMLGTVALFAFGARASLGTMMLAFPFILFIDLKNYDAKSASAKFFTYLILFAICILLCWYVLSFTSFGERILSMSKFDDDSADARSRVFDMFHLFSFRDLLFGVSEDEILMAMHLEDVFIIENFWVVYIFKYGIILTGLLFISLCVFLISLFRNTGPVIKYILAFQFLIAASGNNSLATNTTAVAIVVLASLAGLNAYSYGTNEITEYENKQPKLTT